MEPLQRREINNNLFGDNARIYQGDVVHNHWPRGQEGEKANCLSDLRITDPRHDKIRIESTKGGLLEESYNWIFEHKDFQQWRDNEDRPLLWIKGNPGKGKTMLLCGIINKLWEQRNAETLVSYFFCQATDSRINSATAVLRGLIYLAIDERPELISHIPNKYSDGKKPYFDDINAWVVLSEIFLDMLNDIRLKRSFIIIDALDE
ncbi:NACHT domain-containing protein [Trichoderma evansii]